MPSCTELLWELRNEMHQLKEASRPSPRSCCRHGGARLLPIAEPRLREPVVGRCVGCVLRADLPLPPGLRPPTCRPPQRSEVPVAFSGPHACLCICCFLLGVTHH